ncbi:cobyric acid synthase [Oceanispirochaeta sp.]|uniref:cobyric acid synthase n=1 Tax=Oceanispirochaeta sp. TaxID=2035350 RepID=UPI002639B23D|nr:cobyric acid synthase [Oceanispirochaeta sp.]MDA3955846.1 cobyric acid synthase [Oceanispirochaeta sp.]
MAKTLMIQGTCSDAGKSILVAAFCRIYTRRGYRVSPFKSQNMSLNSFVTPEGYEIGRAQAVQAQAAKRAPHVDMNPVLLKPEGDSRSQIVLMGKPWKSQDASDYFMTKKALWVEVSSALDRLMDDNDLVIIEGAGSPAEINLNEHEIVNMAVARFLDAPVLLTGDIDRGGVFASLYGTLVLVDEDRHRIKGFLINKFRGDVSLLTPGLKMLEDRCGGVPTLGVIPFIPDIYLAQEDSVFIDKNRQFGDRDGLPLVVIKLPHMSNYDDFDPFLNEKGLSIHFISQPSELPETTAALLLPGTKTTIQDLQWLKETGLFARIRQLAEEGTPVVGICGGYQMMGSMIQDPEAVETGGGSMEALGLLNAKTIFSKEKTTLQTRGRLILNKGFFRNIHNQSCSGYEIHMGETRNLSEGNALYRREDGSFDGSVSEDGLCWGSYMHGIFDNQTLRRAFLMSLGWHPGEEGKSEETLREQEFERIADVVEQAVDMDALDRLIGLKV